MIFLQTFLHLNGRAKRAFEEPGPVLPKSYAPLPYPVLFAIVLMPMLFPSGLPAQARPQEGTNKKGVLLKNLARISSVRSNQLVGYGLVVGLPGTGDTKGSLASKTVQNLLGNLGQNALASARSKPQNVAAVLVTAELPPFVASGDRLNATVSSIGDARSLEGGVLVQTPLYAGDKKVYAIAQGPLSTGGRNRRLRARKGLTVGQVISGAIVEKAPPPDVLKKSNNPERPNSKVRISLVHFDFSTMARVQKRLREAFPKARILSQGGSLLVTIPEHEDPIAYIARMEQLRIEPDQRARIVINVRTGTVVMGGDVRVDPVAVSRGGMELIVTGEVRDAQKGIHLEVLGQEKKKPVTTEFQGTSIQEIVKSLNAMGANVRDIIAILEALRDAGALHAELIVN